VIPLRDVIPSRTTPFVTLGLIAANVIVFVYELALPGPALTRFFFDHGLVPAEFTWAAAFSSMFLHSGWLHIGGNMLSLWIFGDNIEDRMGHARFLVFYLVVGLAATLAQAAADSGSGVPLIGASGAIAGVMGAYLVLFPSSRILVLVFLLFFIDVVEIPALLYLGFWFLLQIVGGAGRVGESGGGVAFWAHAAGFIAGIAGVLLFRRRERQRVDWWGN
jgi:membrane associated rhomboid family serine protease